MSVARVRVEGKPLSINASKDEKERNFRILFSIFKKAVAESGILNRYKLKQAHETESQKKRRKRKEAQLQRKRDEAETLQSKLRDRFG